ncbi:hypothetical protein H4R19_005552 [Coemansia spiralis]|nr:hypothetical protein H4R19_005552 [Coemansia spiralis]
MHATLQRPRLPQLQRMPMLAPTPAALHAHEDADNIDDILRNLWPTSRAEPTPGVVRPHAPMTHGPRTPPADNAPAYAVPMPPPPLPPPSRPFSAAIQMGDPEWRMDSASAGCPDLPSPVSPTMPCAPQAGVPPSTACQPALGLGPAVRPPPPSLRRATLGLLHPAAPFSKPASAARPPPPRAMTSEERVARLHSVSGLAARAVARRCLSGRIPALDADALHRPAPPPPPVLLLLPPAAQAKPSFADVARGSQD